MKCKHQWSIRTEGLRRIRELRAKQKEGQVDREALRPQYGDGGYRPFGPPPSLFDSRLYEGEVWYYRKNEWLIEEDKAFESYLALSNLKQS